MTDNDRTSLLDPIAPCNLSQKQHDLKTKKMLAFRAKYRRQRHYHQLKKRRDAHCAQTLLFDIAHSIHAKPDYKTNIHCLFYPKPIREANKLAEMRNLLKKTTWL